MKNFIYGLLLAAVLFFLAGMLFYALADHDRVTATRENANVAADLKEREERFNQLLLRREELSGESDKLAERIETLSAELQAQEAKTEQWRVKEASLKEVIFQLNASIAALEEELR